MTTSSENANWDYTVSPELIPWSQRAHNPHSHHLGGAGGHQTTEMMARRELGIHPALILGEDW